VNELGGGAGREHSEESMLLISLASCLYLPVKSLDSEIGMENPFLL